MCGNGVFVSSEYLVKRGTFGWMESECIVFSVVLLIFSVMCVVAWIIGSIFLLFFDIRGISSNLSIESCSILDWVSLYYLVLAVLECKAWIVRIVIMIYDVCLGYASV